MTPEKLENLTRLKGTFFRHPRHAQLEEAFNRLLEQRRAEMKLGLRREATGIAVIGASGSGKTTSVQRLIAKHPDLVLPRKNRLQADIISFQVPSPATLKDVGMTALHALGYPLQRDRPAGVIWNQVRFFLEKRKTLLLHIDEAQDLYTVKSDNVLRHVLNTLKSLMQNKDWPVGIVLSGLPEVGRMLNFDVQLTRRFIPIELLPITLAADSEMIRDVVRTYLNKSGLQPATDIVSDAFMGRLLHASASEFGLFIEILLEAIEEAYRIETGVLGIDHFTSAYRRRTGCVDGLNPFIVDDYRDINPRKLLGRLDVGPVGPGGIV